MTLQINLKILRFWDPNFKLRKSQFCFRPHFCPPKSKSRKKILNRAEFPSKVFNAPVDSTRVSIATVENIERVMVALCAKFSTEINDRRHCLSVFVHYDAAEEIPVSSPWKSMRNEIFMIYDDDSAVQQSRISLLDRTKKKKSEEYNDDIRKLLLLTYYTEIKI